MSRPLSDLSPSKQNSRSTPVHFDQQLSVQSPVKQTSPLKVARDMAAPGLEAFPAADFGASPAGISQEPSSPRKAFSPVKYRLQDDDQAMSSPPGSPVEGTVRINDGLTRAMGDMEREELANSTSPQTSPQPITPDEGMSTLFHDAVGDDTHQQDVVDETDITFDMAEKTGIDETVGDLSTISAIPTDMTRFANLRNSPTKPQRGDSWSPSKQLRNSVLFNTPGAAQRPLHLLARNNTYPEDDEATPRRRPGSGDSPTDLMNFTGQSNIIIPPPASAPRTTRRSPSGRRSIPNSGQSKPNAQIASITGQGAHRCQITAEICTCYSRTSST